MLNKDDSRLIAQEKRNQALRKQAVDQSLASASATQPRSAKPSTRRKSNPHKAA